LESEITPMSFLISGDPSRTHYRALLPSIHAAFVLAKVLIAQGLRPQTLVA
jgi:hypothetical protein